MNEHAMAGLDTALEASIGNGSIGEVLHNLRTGGKLPAAMVYRLVHYGHISKFMRGWAQSIFDKVIELRIGHQVEHIGRFIDPSGVIVSPLWTDWQLFFAPRVEDWIETMSGTVILIETRYPATRGKFPGYVYYRLNKATGDYDEAPELFEAFQTEKMQKDQENGVLLKTRYLKYLEEQREAGKEAKSDQPA